MKDNELYEFFKGRAVDFDEVPSNDLWHRIEKKLAEPSALSSKTGRQGLSGKFLLLSGSIVMALVIWIIANNRGKVGKETKMDVKAAGQITVPVVIKPEQKDINRITDTVKKKKTNVLKPAPVHIRLLPLTGVQKLPVIPETHFFSDSLKLVESKFRSEPATFKLLNETIETETITINSVVLPIAPQTIKFKSSDTVNRSKAKPLIVHETVAISRDSLPAKPSKGTFTILAE
ncbi:hypothetical protein OGH69_04700 [Flavobacterium sp. MFBS3-15]|uniref:hypothetical protein n=1 Tax=Flavobacterium sp. MFBS3-15 TaxID=2989816 RepID=UPI002235E4F4|nr:hypothetical protein [Flavobacterium sp. MFBS3-15]MCW4468257.1 hypothetical protein [Flavobacterium sp. MFBS3-15]